jgi:hypothetical protein
MLEMVPSDRQRCEYFNTWLRERNHDVRGIKEAKKGAKDEDKKRTKNSFFWDISPRSGLKVNRRSGVKYCLDFQDRIIGQAKNQRELDTLFTLISCLSYFSTLKMEATFYPESWVRFQETTCRYILQDRTLHNHRSDNLKSCEMNVSWILFCSYFEICVQRREARTKLKGPWSQRSNRRVLGVIKWHFQAY